MSEGNGGNLLARYATDCRQLRSLLNTSMEQNEVLAEMLTTTQASLAAHIAGYNTERASRRAAERQLAEANEEISQLLMERAQSKDAS